MVLGWLISGGVTLLLVILGALIKYRRWYWLIAGYNTAPASEKAKYDIIKLGRFLGNGLFVLAGLWFVTFCSYSLGQPILSLALIAIFVFALIFIVLTAQRFHSDSRRQKGTLHPGLRIALLLIISISIFVGGLLIYGARPTTVTVDATTVTIGGMYGLEIPLTEIVSVSLERELPPIRRKINGFDLGNILKGDFALQGLGRGRLFLYAERPPYIHLKLPREFVFLNFADSTQTAAVCAEITQQWQASHIIRQ